MRTVFIFLVSLIILPAIGACGQSTAGEQQNPAELTPASAVEVYYFHFTRRCVSCVNVQKATEKVLKDHYGKELENGSIVYHEINLSEPGSREIAQKLGVGRQALLVTSGDRNLDLTMQGFMLASRDYNQFKAALDEAIEKVKN
jgi:hypothetical protein